MSRYFHGLTSLVVLSAILTVLSAQSTEELIEERETIVGLLEAEAQALHDSRAAGIAQCSCTKHSCSQTLEAGTCVADFPPDERVCNKDCQGRMLDYDHVSIRTPMNAIDSELVKEHVCTFRGLESTLISLADREDGPRTNIWSYAGTTAGVHVIWPSQVRRGEEGVNKVESLEQCAAYDPRLRPWYTSALSGPKDVVLLIDLSASMLSAPSGVSRWALVQQALPALLQTFTAADQINIVWFSSDAFKVEFEGSQSPPLYPATEEIIEKLSLDVETTRPQGNTDMGDAFEVAFDTLIAAATRNEGAGSAKCTRAIVFMTDGLDCGSPFYPEYDSNCSTERTQVNPAVLQPRSDRSTVLDRIKAKQDELAAIGSGGGRAKIFTYAMGGAADSSLPRMIACQNEGAYEFIEDGVDPLTAMGGFFSYMAAGRSDSAVAWSNPYEDDSGLGEITTASKAVYASPVGNVQGQLVGVVGTDVRMADLRAAGASSEDVLDRLVRRSRVCQRLEWPPCEIQVLRGRTNFCPEVREWTTGGSVCYKSAAVARDVSSGAIPSKLYFRLDDVAAQDVQAQRCRDAGAQLATINGSAEAHLVAGLASPDGSWIGLRGGAWNDDVVAAPSEERSYSEMWVERSREVQSTVGKCATIDPRAGNRNIEALECGAKRSAVCETTSQENCAETVTLEGRDFDHIHFDQCGTYEESIDLISRGDGRAANTDAICPLEFGGESTEELTCCPECIGSSSSKTGLIIGLVVAGLIVLAICVVLLWCFKRSHSSGKEKRANVHRLPPLPGHADAPPTRPY